MTLVEFLNARLCEDAAAAGVATEGPWLRWRDQEGIPGWDGFIVLGDAAAEGEECNAVGRVYAEADADHILRHDPARVLREVEAKRRIVDLHDYTHVCPGGNRVSDPEFQDGDYGGPCETLRLLAAPYADHPDYRTEWDPQPNG